MENTNGPGVVLRVGKEVVYFFQITENRIQHFGHATGDRRRIHFNTSAAREAGFTMEDGQLLAQNKLVLACADAQFDFHFPNTIVREIHHLKFKQPVKSGDMVFVRTRVEEIQPCEIHGAGAIVILSSRFLVSGLVVLECQIEVFTKLPFELDAVKP